MPTNESPPVSVARRGSKCIGSDPLRTVVWVRGEHDLATRVRLAATLAEAAGLDDADIVVDLSGVTFMDASTIGALLVAHNRLRAVSRSLTVRDPSRPAQRLFDLCELKQLIDHLPEAEPPVGTALATWVIVPPKDPGRVSPQPPVTPAEPVQEPARTAVGKRAQPARAIQRRRAPP